jgi:chemotaxis protein methyltransferase CheR
MLVAETGLFSWGWEVEIIGLDIDKKALRTAEKAVYTGHSFRGLNGRREDFISRYFNRGGGDNYSVKPFLRSKVSFVHGNLLDPELFVCLGPVDAIFCRNVFIYMGDEAVSAAARNFHSCLDRAGYLFLGSAETLIQKTDLFAPEFTGGVVVYRKTNDDG